ncbi:MAG TPA: response regulator [Burkholderiales bacterium]|nr:response regulator [Burkholderiales bacterium]
MSEHTLKVLIVDDSAEDRAEIRRLLLSGSDRRYVFLEAETGAAAVQTAAGCDCVILDYRLPDMDARHVLEALREGADMTRTPVLVVTGTAGTHFGAQLLRAGAMDYFSKSCMNAESLTRAVETAIQRFKLLVEHSRTQERLRESHRFISELTALLPNVVYVFDLEARRNVYVNRQTGAMIGYSEEEVSALGSEFLPRLMHPEDLLRFNAYVPRLAHLAEGETTEFEYRLKHRDGSWRWFRSRDTAFVRWPDGNVRQILGTATDITERKAAEEALREADKRKDNFIATLAHELRNPLAPIRNAIAVMRQKGPSTPDVQWCRDVIDRQVEQMARLLEDLLDVSRITRGKITLRRERVLLSTVIEQAVEMARPLVDAPGHELKVSMPASPVLIDGDPTRLAQIFCNLLTNAAKYTEGKGVIRLSAEQHDGQIVVEVQDSGIGISAEHLPRLFEMFGQVESALQRAQGGLGIGLSLAKALVEMHGGQISAHSEGLGKGTTFTVRLPVVGARQQTLALDDACGGNDRRLRKRRIVIADDLHDSAESLAMLLEIMGNEVRVAYDGEEAVEVAEAFRPEAVLLDIGMPKLNGYEACQRIRAQPWGKDMVLIAHTGWGQEEDVRRAKEAGFDHHLIKPCDPSALLRVLGEARAQAAADYA